MIIKLTQSHGLPEAPKLGTYASTDSMSAMAPSVSWFAVSR